MARHLKIKDRTGEKTIQALLQEKRIEQQQRTQIKRLEQTRDVRLNNIETQSRMLRETLASYGKGMTNLSSYFKKGKCDVDKNIIWFPLERTHTDWEPRPCCVGTCEMTKDMCIHFPCRNITSYHFMFRELPGWVLTNAEESVRKSKTASDMSARPNGSARNLDIYTHITGEDPSAKYQDIYTNKKETTTLPEIHFTDDMPAKERKLKIIISKKRLQNELENKPLDRCVNYGKPTPIRRLLRPVRPSVQPMDMRS